MDEKGPKGCSVRAHAPPKDRLFAEISALNGADFARTQPSRLLAPGELRLGSLASQSRGGEHMNRGVYQEAAMPQRGVGSSAALATSLLLLGLSYALLIAAPLVSRQFQALTGGALTSLQLQRWVPAAAGFGLAVGGGAALVFVLDRLIRDLRQNPYSCVAPVLAVFAGSVLIGLRANLPIAGIALEPLSVFALALAVIGGSLAEHPALAARLLGLGLSLFPTLSLLGAVWAGSGQSELTRAIWALEPRGRVFLAVLGVSSLGFLLVGAVARVLPVAIASSPQAQAQGRAHIDGRLEPRASAREDTLDLWLEEAEVQLKRRGRSWWFWALVLIPLGLGVLLALRSSLARPGTRFDGNGHFLSEPARSLAALPSVSARHPEVASAPGVPSVEQLAPSLAPSVTGAVEQTAAAPEPVVEQALLAAAPVREVAVPVEQALGDAPERTEGAGQVLPVIALEARADQVRQRPARNHEGSVRHPQRLARPRWRPGTHKQESARDVTRTEAPPVELAPAPEPAPVSPKVSAKAVVAAVPKAAPKVAAAPTRGDESLDELMDRVVDPKTKASPKVRSAVPAGEDPIFGL
jgi:hypothetical protein